MFGDSVSSFSRLSSFENLPTDFKTAILDFNKDGNLDILFLDKYNGSLSALISTGEEVINYETLEFYSESSIIDFVKNEDKFNPKLYLLDKTGHFHSVSSINLASGVQGLFTKGSPGIIKDFAGKTGLTSVAVFDTSAWNLNLSISTFSLLSHFISYPVTSSFKNLFIGESNRNSFTFDSLKTFLLYNQNDQLIEVLNLNLNNLELNSNNFYTDYPVVDICTQSDKINTVPTIITLNKRYDEIGITNYNFRNFRYIPSDFFSIDKEVYSAHIINNGDDTNINYWKIEKDSLFFTEYSLVTDKKITRLALPISGGNKVSSNLFKIEINGILSSVIQIEDSIKTKLLIVVENRIVEIPLITEEFGEIEQIESSEFNKNNERHLFILCDHSSSIFQIKLDRSFSVISVNKLVESEQVVDFFVTRLYNKQYLFYISDSNNYINLIEINENK